MNSYEEFVFHNMFIPFIPMEFRMRVKRREVMSYMVGVRNPWYMHRSVPWLSGSSGTCRESVRVQHLEAVIESPYSSLGIGRVKG